ncbi:MAG: ATP-binding protein [Calditerrivibrio sp.]|nr:ATP-binding protein [Calditerrivibrio sp.]
MTFNSISFKMKMALIIGIIIILTSAYMFWKKIYTIVVENLAEKYAKTSVLYQKERISGILNKELTISRLMSNSKILTLWGKHEENILYKDLALQEFENFRKHFTSKSAFFVINNSLNYYYSDEKSGGVAKIIKTLNPENKDDIWYFITIKQPTLYTLNVDFDKEVGKTNLWINVVMIDDGILRGVIGTGIEITDFVNEFIEKTEEGTIQFILQEDGTIFASKDKSLMNLRIVDKSKKQTTIFDISNEKGKEILKNRISNLLQSNNLVDIFKVNLLGNEYMVAISHIPELKWVILTAINIDKILNIQQLLLPIISVFLLMVILIVAFGYIVQRMLINPIKTIAVSANRIKEGNYDTKIEYNQNDEIGELTNIFNLMSAKIKEHVEDLEIKVADRTKELAISKDKISTLLDSSGEGFLKFGSDYKIDKEYSSVCKEIFGKDIAGVDIVELLFPEDKTKQQNIRNLLKSVFQQENTFLKETMLELLPPQVDILDKTYQLTYKLSKDKNIILIMKDITDEKMLEKQLENERKMLKFVVEYVKDEYVTKELIKEFKDFILNIHLYPLNIIKKELHTFKGNFLQKGFINLPELIHIFEENLEYALSNREKFVDSLFASLKKDMDILRKYLEKDFVDENFVRISEERLTILANRLKIEHNPLHKEIKNFLKINLLSYFDNFRKLVERVSEREGKLVRFDIECKDNIQIYIPDYFKCLSSLYHIFTNAVIHGIETPQVREAKGKSEVGNVTVRISKSENYLIIKITDDGKGIDQEELEKIFLEGYTSIKEADIYKGRGVGLSAVKFEIEKIGGKIEVISEKDLGTEVLVKIPYEE